jgi:[glutamine synthetase] adenylyltransferase / [glutamine synthetase]-adenylyl-L-tyrosine phosphorylase
VTVFKDSEAAERAKARLQELTLLNPERLLGFAFDDSPDPDLSLINLERWLKVTANPGTYLALLDSQPDLAKLLILLLGASQPVADALIQNPELASLLTDEDVLRAPLRAEVIRREGCTLLGSATSYSHRLDRLRYLKQRYTLQIVVNDLSGGWAPEEAWRALSALADALLDLTIEVSWRDYSAGRDLPKECPIGVVAFGKLGGSELNYSSDVDLVYVLDELPDMAEALEKHAPRFLEIYGRALSEHMGRGALYRVDLRLRPFGKAGPIAASMRAIEAYYRSHAEAWEHQALIRSRMVAGPAGLADRWEDLVTANCFRPNVSDYTIDQLLQNRDAIEEHAPVEDLKRGPGGIRDVEFLTQVLQIVHGHRHPAVRAKSTIDALDALAAHGLISAGAHQSLSAGYRFLRQLEHRCQLLHDRQTHSLPEDVPSLNRIAHLMGLSEEGVLRTQLQLHRDSIRKLYGSMLRAVEHHEHDDRAEVAARTGSLAAHTLSWFDRLPERDAFYSALVSNRDSLARVERILAVAPALVPELRESVPLTEALLSGEVEEDDSFLGPVGDLHADSSLEHVAELFRDARAALLVRQALNPGAQLERKLADLWDCLLVHVMHRLYADFDVLALGSYGTRDPAADSDLDVVFLAPDGARRDEAEAHAQSVLSIFDLLRRRGLPVQLDLRLRPEGGKGLLVRSYAGLKTYDLEGMEMWERFALGQNRLVCGSEAALDLVQKCAYAVPLTPERLRELVAMKRRIEQERVPPQYSRRNVKLGIGGLSDIEWFVHLYEMRFPTATLAGPDRLWPERIRSLARANLINAIELEELLLARDHLMAVRRQLALLGYPRDIVPENPDKLDRLASVMGFPEGNAFLAHHERIITAVRSIYSDGLERLKA